MNKFKEIRPIVLGVLVKDNKILVGELFNSKTNKTFYRCLGGGIEFLEKSEDALKREFKEEINVDIEVKSFLGISENIFVYEGKNAHELVLYYLIDISDDEYRDSYSITEGDRKYIAKWIDINEFKDNKKTIYPEEIFKYI